MIPNNRPLIDTLNKLSNRRRAQSVSTHDFSKLLTNISHNKLNKTLNSVIDFVFKSRAQNKMSINNCSIANWCKSSKYFLFDTNSLKKAVEYLIRNYFFALGDHDFQQRAKYTTWLIIYD